ncbi:hypothetical protein GCM10027446_32710 [Angustibacter peucedani]
MFREVPVLPVVVPAAGVLFVVLLWSLQRRDRLAAPSAAVALALSVYAAGVVANTVFPVFLDKPGRHAPWSAALNLVPLAGYEGGDAVMNVVVFLPLGVLLALVLARSPWWKVLVVAGLSSLAVEVAQLVTARVLGGGHVADVNDLVFDVAGAALGVGLLAVLSRPPALDAVINRFRWG